MTEVGVGPVLASVLRRDPSGTVVDIPAMSLNHPGVAGGLVIWHVFSWVPVDPLPTREYRSVRWPPGQSRGHRPPQELVAGDVIEFARVTTVDGEEQLRIRWFGVCQSISGAALVVRGTYPSLGHAIDASHHLVTCTQRAVLDGPIWTGVDDDLGDDALGY